MTTDEQYMNMCLQLAALGAGNVAPNPMVGAVLVHEDRIIGEGYHQQYGFAHAEVNCINSVTGGDKNLITESTLYVSLEPCAHYGKTPPCTDLIIKNAIKKVVIGCIDIYKEVAGKGIQKLQNAGVATTTGVLENECIEMNKRFFTYYKKQRPYIILKWAQTINGKIGSANDKRIFISNKYTNRLVHKWRTEEAGILIGKNTALQDDPLLTARLWKGKNPVRIIIDKNLLVPSSAKIFNNHATTIIYNSVKNAAEDNIIYHAILTENFMDAILQSLYEMKIQSILVEGGTKTLQSFIDKGLWDEARVITNESLVIETGIASPEMKNFLLVKKEDTTGDLISHYINAHTASSVSITSSAGN